MKAVFKYPLELKPEDQVLSLPWGAEILHVGDQQGILCLWALVEPPPEAKPTERCFVVRATGQAVGRDEVYLGTVGQMNGQLVWHIFERISIKTIPVS